MESRIRFGRIRITCGRASRDSVFDNDAHIWEIHASKIWGVDGAIEIGEIE